VSEATTTALEKHACAACGAQAEWQPARQILACPYCGTESPCELDRDSRTVREIPLVATLRELPEEMRGWIAPRKSVKCRSCHAVSVFEPDRVGQNCEFCGSPELVDYEEIRSPLRPQSLIPFKLDREAVRSRLRKWIAGKWLAPSRFKRKALVDTVSGIYLPYWTFDARTRCPWTAESGTYYYTTQTYRDSKGRTRTRQVRHIRWRPAAGLVERFFDDEPIPASRGIDPGLLRGIEPFPAGELVPYDTGFLSGFVVEHYQVVLVDAARRSRESMTEQLRGMCAAQVPGDTYRNLQIQPEFTGETFKHILVPVWVSTYNFAGKSFQVVVNGLTGAIRGRYPKSLWKILGLVLAGSSLIGLILLLHAYL
jgi:hypothetical protein